MDRTGDEGTCYLLLSGGRGAPQTLVFRSEDQARAEFRRVCRAGRARTQWMELSMVAIGRRPVPG